MRPTRALPSAPPDPRKGTPHNYQIAGRTAVTGVYGMFFQVERG